MSARRARFAILALACACAAPAQALFDTREMETIDVSAGLDQEYFLHLRTFSPPLVWDDAFAASTGPAYRVNGASLGCCDLLLQQELRFKKSLTKGLDFRFRLLQDEDREHQYFHYQLELEQKLGLGFSGIMFGEPTFRKEDSDIGFGLAYAPGPALRASARHTFVDFNFNKRGHTTERYKTYPATDELRVEAKPAPDWRAEAALMVDSPLRREVPDENRTFSYRRTNVDLSLRHEPAGSFSRRLSYGYEYESKGDLFAPAPAGKTSVSTAWTAHRVLAAVEGSWGRRDRFELGQALLWRNAHADFPGNLAGGLRYRRWEAQPYARWRRDIKPWLTSEVAGFFSFGENRQLGVNDGPAQYRTVAESTLGVGADFVFSKSGRIAVYGTVDLDELRSHTWDGGNIRAMFLF